MCDKGGFSVHNPCLCPLVPAVALASLGQAPGAFIDTLLHCTSPGLEPRGVLSWQLGSLHQRPKMWRCGWCRGCFPGPLRGLQP